jgi:hypothetical protein
VLGDLEPEREGDLVAAAGRRALLRFVDAANEIMRFAGGRCAERWSQADFLGLLPRPGAIPAA